MKLIYVTLLLILFGVATTGAGAQATWGISERPTLVIGTVDGPPSSAFHDIRGVVTAGDSLIVVADGGSKELRVFTSAGGAVAAFGGEGDGPREFRSIHWADGCGGASVVVYDLFRRRVTRWDAGGSLLEEFNIESTEPDRPAYALSCGPRGGFAVIGWPDVLGSRVDQGPYRLDTSIGVLGPTGRLEKILGSFPGPERYRFPGDRLSDGPRYFGRSTIARMGRGGVFVGIADSYEIEVFRTDGHQFTFGKPHQQRKLTEEMLEAWQDSILALMSADDRPAMKRAMDGWEIPETLPAYADFRFDELGSLWVADFPTPGQDPVRWDVWDVSGSDGVQIATIDIPRDFQPMEIGGDYLLGVSTDSVGVQRVHRYRLSR